MKIPMLHHIIYGVIILGLGVALAVTRSAPDVEPSSDAAASGSGGGFTSSGGSGDAVSSRFPTGGGSQGARQQREREPRARDIIMSMNQELERAGIAVDEELEEEMRRQAERLDRMREWRTSSILFDMRDDFKVTDRVAESWGLDSSQRAQLDNVLSQSREKLREVEKGLAQRLTDEEGNEFYRIPSYSTQKERLVQELKGQYSNIVGSERAELLTKYAPEISSAGEGMRELRVRERRGTEIVEVHVFDNQGNLVARPRWRAGGDDVRSERYQHLLEVLDED